VQDAEEYRRQWTACMERMRDNRLPMKAIQFRAREEDMLEDHVEGG
jgi:hypothetical protein